jgi:hypothetical protein
MSRFLTRTGEAAEGREPGRSVYEDRGKRRRITPIIRIFDGGRVETGVEVDGKYAPSESLKCCESALDCRRPECWTRIGYIGEPDFEDWLWR